MRDRRSRDQRLATSTWPRRLPSILALSSVLLGSACTGAVTEAGPLGNSKNGEDDPGADPSAKAGRQSTAGSESGEAGRASTAGSGDTDASDSNPPTGSTSGTTSPFAAHCDASSEYVVPDAATYATRIKRLLSTEPLSNSELKKVQDDPDALTDLIDGWLMDEASTPKLLEFFATAFQQDGHTFYELNKQFGLGTREGLVRGVTDEGEPDRAAEWVALSVRESFARTALHFLRNDSPFTNVTTTNTFMLNTPLMVLLAWNDQAVREDGSLYYPDYGELADEITEVAYVREEIPMTESLDPSHSNFMRFTYPQDALECISGADVVKQGDERRYLSRAVRAIFGGFGRLGSGCPVPDGEAYAMFERDEWVDWRPITIRRPTADERTHRFYEVEEFRTSDALILNTPRVGYFSTPAFFATWPTNADNSFRVTLNQTLIAGLGLSIETPALIPEFDDGLDGDHAAPGTSCFGCHSYLDPMRNYFRREYSDQSYRQTDSEAQALPARFLLGGQEVEGTSIEQFGELLSSQTQFASAWVQKLCYHATNYECPTSAPEFERAVAAFVESNFNLKTLFKTLYASPLITGAQCVEGGTGDTASMARQRHFCGTMASRLGVSDPCFKLYTRGRGSSTQQRIYPIAPTIPDDTYSRGVTEPLLIGEGNMFVSGAYERICEALAEEAVGPERVLHSGQSAEEAATAAVEQVMAILPDDPRHDALLTLFGEHYQSALADSDAATALQSVFVLACLSPAVIGMGL